VDLEDATAFEGVEARQSVRPRPWLVARLDPDLVAVHEDTARSRRDDDGVRHGPAAVGGRVELVEAGVDAAEVVGELSPGGVEIEVAQLHCARISEAVDEKRWRERKRPGGQDALLPFRSDEERQLPSENEEEVAVRVMDVRRCAVTPRPEPRPCHDELVPIAQDLDTPLHGVADDLAFARH